MRCESLVFPNVMLIYTNATLIGNDYIFRKRKDSSFVIQCQTLFWNSKQIKVRLGYKHKLRDFIVHAQERTTDLQRVINYWPYGFYHRLVLYKIVKWA